MLNKEDLNQIGQLFDQKFGEVKTELILELGDVIEQNITPQFEEVRVRLDGMDRRLDGVDKRLDGMDKRLDGVDKRLENLDRSIGRTDGKVNSLINVLQDIQVITENDKLRILS